MIRWLSVAAAVGIMGLAAQEGTPPRNDEGRYEYREVVKVPDLSAEQIYERALQWVKAEYKNPAQKIQRKDPEHHQLVLRHKVRVPSARKSGAPWIFIHYKLRLEVKDGKYRYRLFDLHLQNGNRKYPIERWTDKGELPPKEAQKYLAFLDKELRALAERMKQYIAQPPERPTDDW